FGPSANLQRELTSPGDMISQGSTANVSAKLEYPACPVCGSDQRQFPFRLHPPYSVACCTACGFHYLYPRLIESAIQEAYRESSYYEGGACGYADASYTAQESALRATFKRLLHNLAGRGLTSGDLLEIGCGYGYLLDEARPFFEAPEHVLYFDFWTLSALMHQAGLTNVRRLPYPHAFPLGLLTAKFGLTMPPLLARPKVWVPATTVAAYGRVSNA